MNQTSMFAGEKSQILGVYYDEVVDQRRDLTLVLERVAENISERRLQHAETHLIDGSQLDLRVARIEVVHEDAGMVLDSSRNWM